MSEICLFSTILRAITHKFITKFISRRFLAVNLVSLHIKIKSNVGKFVITKRIKWLFLEFSTNATNR